MSTGKSSAGDKLSMKLLVDTKAQRVLFGEASKDVVDFLFSLLTLPVGTIVKLLTMDSMAGSIGNLYSSVDRLDDTYLCRDNAKDALLTPPGGSESSKLLQLPGAVAPQLYRCNTSLLSFPNCRKYVTMVRGTTCANCYNKMSTPVQLVYPAACSDSYAGSRAAGVGFVQEVVTYTVMDDLTVAPMSTISGITLLNTFGITDIGSLQEKTVQLGYREGLEMLRAWLQSKTVLTDVFLGKKRKAGSH
ncbi:unnamed protein product [Alopecurus aequalis]